jgi:hypothetical protein
MKKKKEIDWNLIGAIAAGAIGFGILFFASKQF